MWDRTRTGMTMNMRSLYAMKPKTLQMMCSSEKRKPVTACSVKSDVCGHATEKIVPGPMLSMSPGTMDAHE